MQTESALHSVQIYSQAQDLVNRGTVFGRRLLFKRLGGSFFKPEVLTGYPDENRWRVCLHGLCSTADSCDDAIRGWAALVIATTPRTASEGRPDDPYNGAGLAPPSPATPAA